MLTTIGLAFVAGFFLGNGMPYYVQGSTGDGRHPGPFRDGPAVSVLIGCIAFAIAAAAWAFAHPSDHLVPAYTAALAGPLRVALIHTRNLAQPQPLAQAHPTPPHPTQPNPPPSPRLPG